MDLKKLTTSDKILFGAGLVFLISTFFNWFEVSIAGFTSVGATGWDVGFFWAGLPFFTVLAMMIWVGVQRFSKTQLPTEIAPLYLVGGVGVALIVLLKLIIGEDGPIDRAFGLYLASIAAIGVAYAGFLKFQESGGNLNTLGSQLKAKAGEMGDKAKKKD